MIVFFDILILGTLFSAGGILLFLAFTHWDIPLINRINWRAGAGKFVFNVLAGTVTWFITQGVFGQGVEEATATGFVTAVVIGGVTKFFGEA